MQICILNGTEDNNRWGVLQSTHPNQARLRVVKQALSKLGGTCVTRSTFCSLVAAFLAPLEDPLDDSTEHHLLIFKLEDRMRALARSYRLDVLAKERKLHTHLSYCRTLEKRAHDSEIAPLLEHVKSVCRLPTTTRAQQMPYDQLQVRCCRIHTLETANIRAFGRILGCASPCLMGLITLIRCKGLGIYTGTIVSTFFHC